MVRPRKPRFVEGEPTTAYFKPRGVPVRELEEVRLSVEELESIRLVDREGLSQEEAALRMEVSRSTLQRTLAEARKKVADALSQGKALGISGGNYVEAGPGGKRWFECITCGHQWTEPFGTGSRACDASCPDCGEATVVRTRAGQGRKVWPGSPGRAPGGHRGARGGRTRKGASL